MRAIECVPPLHTTLYVFVCVFVYVCVSCLPDVLAHPNNLTDTCCICRTSDSSQTGLTKTSPKSLRLETSGYIHVYCCRQHRGPHTFVGRREGGGGSSVVPRPLYVTICGKFISLLHREYHPQLNIQGLGTYQNIEVRSLPPPPPPPTIHAHVFVSIARNANSRHLVCKTELNTFSPPVDKCIN